RGPLRLRAPSPQEAANVNDRALRREPIEPDGPACHVEGPGPVHPRSRAPTITLASNPTSDVQASRNWTTNEAQTNWFLTSQGSPRRIVLMTGTICTLIG